MRIGTSLGTEDSLEDHLSWMETANKVIVIVGAGALGSHVAMLLRNVKENLKVVDFDRVEQKNIQAQFHTKMGLSMNKAAALGRALQGMFGVQISTIPHKLTKDNVASIMDGARLVIDCTDNIAARKVIQDYCRRRIPCLHGALSADGTFGQVIWSDHRFVPDPEGKDGAPTCEDGEHLPFFVLVASHMALAAQSFLEKGKKYSLQVSPMGIIRMG